MTYLSEKPSGRFSTHYKRANDGSQIGEPEKRPIMEGVVDLPRLAKDVAKELGGVVTTKGEYPNEQQSVQVVAADGKAVEVSFRSDTCKAPDKTRIHVYLNVPDVKYEDRNMYNAAHKTATASVSPTKSAAVIAKDIKKRVIEASADAVAAQRTYAEAQRAARNGVQEVAAQLAKLVSGVKVRVADDKLSASFYVDKPYISGRISANGSVTIERIDAVNLDKFSEIVRVVKGKSA